jgi:hypothetical protein
LSIWLASFCYSSTASVNHKAGAILGALGRDEKTGGIPVDEHKPVEHPGWPDEQPPGWLNKMPGWLFYALLIALVVVIMLAAFLLLRPQIAPIFNNVNNDV